MPTVWFGVTVDCLDSPRVARFSISLLGREAQSSVHGWVYLGRRGDPEPRLVFQPVRVARLGKNRLHLDGTVDDVDEAVERVIALGGQPTGERHEYDDGVVVVMTDPEGHEFCVVRYV